MPALVPRTVIMIAEIEPYSQRLVHFEMQRVRQYVLLCVCARVRLSVHMHIVWTYDWVVYFSHNETVRVMRYFII